MNVTGCWALQWKSLWYGKAKDVAVSQSRDGSAQGPLRECSASSGAGLDSRVGKHQRRDMAKNVKILFPHPLCLNTYLHHLSCNQAEQDLDPGIPFTSK